MGKIFYILLIFCLLSCGENGVGDEEEAETNPSGAASGSCRVIRDFRY